MPLNPINMFPNGEISTDKLCEPLTFKDNLLLHKRECGGKFKSEGYSLINGEQLVQILCCNTCGFTIWKD
jgi:hypothetical protein